MREQASFLYHGYMRKQASTMVRNFGYTPWLLARNGANHGTKIHKNTMVTLENQSQPWYCEMFTYHGWTHKGILTLVF